MRPLQQTADYWRRECLKSDDKVASLEGENKQLSADLAVMAEHANALSAIYREALEAVAGFGDVDLSGEWPGPLRDIIRSMTDCAKRALRKSV